MITQQINKHKPPVVHYGRVFPFQQQQHTEIYPYQNRYSAGKPMDKLEYANFLKSLEIKPGDWVAYRLAQAPYGKWSVWRVKEFIEIHHHVTDWGNNHCGPRCMYVQGWDHETQRGADGLGVPKLMTAKDYKVIEYKDVPQELKDMYDHLGNS